MEESNTNATNSARPKGLVDRRRSFRDIQGMISKLNPELLKSVIGSTSSSSIEQSPNISTSSLGKDKSESTSDMAPLTIFYNGTVAVFDVARDKADIILKIAKERVSKAADPASVASSSNQRELPVALEGDLPIKRRKSLQRFLAQRQDRVTLSSPYFCLQKEGTLSPL